jgi:hypothetical protein
VTPTTNAHFERDLIKDLAKVGYSFLIACTLCFARLPPAESAWFYSDQALHMDASEFRTVEVKTLSSDGNFVDVTLDVVPRASESAVRAVWSRLCSPSGVTE